MAPRSIPRSLTVALGLFLAAPSARAQTPVAALAARLAAMTAVTGYERAMGDTLFTLLPGAERDRAGDVVLARGSGTPRRLAVCPMDEIGFVVGEVRPDGYLTLRRSPAPGSAVPLLFDQQLEGQRVTLLGDRGPVPGVVAVRSTHLTRGRADLNGAPFKLDDAYVDVGAATDADVAPLGVHLLTPLALTKRPHRYGADRIAALAAGRRAACAALLAAAVDAKPSRKAPRGTTVVAFVVEQNLSVRGMLTIATSRGPFAETWIADGAGGYSALDARFVPAGPVAALGTVNRWDLPVRYPGTPVESVSLADVERMRATISAWLRGESAQ
ncbi:MAG TPA: hypothetical protein VFW66_12135 [Gemmatimonadales bacterium]|nr:hypothetical protein [Gemmatimonadales bacterium]